MDRRPDPHIEFTVVLKQGHKMHFRDQMKASRMDLQLDRETQGCTNGRMYGRTDVRTDGGTNPFIEMLGRILNRVQNIEMHYPRLLFSFLFIQISTPAKMWVRTPHDPPAARRSLSSVVLRRKLFLSFVYLWVSSLSVPIRIELKAFFSEFSPFFSFCNRRNFPFFSKRDKNTERKNTAEETERSAKKEGKEI